MNDNNPNRRLGIGTWLSSGSPVVAELASECGFDWLLLDMEHGCLTDAGLLASLQSAKRHNLNLIVRVGSFEPAVIARVLDWGASGIMLPHVSCAEQAKQCIKAMRYPPGGTRGYSGSARVFGYGLASALASREHVSPLFIPQIEDYEGVMNSEAIAAVDGVDILFVGPSDLQLALSTASEELSMPYQEALTRIAASAGRYGKQTGILVRNADDVLPLKKAGFSCLAIGSDIGFLKSGFLNAIQEGSRH
ncbi:5-keto-4-deoxy-D-glucarate aldolase [Dyadobacter sp. CECT 9275]|uniref:5-keto-4-deoxy-D-glucarate aldolase n=1 Tax=Dyadobacter helix TaxID=2822344 RepID=A0A916JII2_9BACT|nr:aldolase/citrate lyase family protein [Dyadobacter sp. CECT 9275]CAG5016042.1 5-keto-4-deoxy-D-glucarate aldolase [Dyadobacter sp. CECT 9275]